MSFQGKHPKSSHCSLQFFPSQLLSCSLGHATAAQKLVWRVHSHSEQMADLNREPHKRLAPLGPKSGSRFFEAQNLLLEMARVQTPWGKGCPIHFTPEYSDSQECTQLTPYAGQIRACCTSIQPEPNSLDLFLATNYRPTLFESKDASLRGCYDFVQVMAMQTYASAIKDLHKWHEHEP